MPHIPRKAAALVAVVAVAVLLPSLTLARAAPSKAATAKPTVVLVHGAWADSSSWSGVVSRLQKQSYTVDVVPNPLRGLATDSAYLARYLKTVSGPIVLVGHSYGGMLITNAAAGNSEVKALVYIDAYMPAEGETVLDLSTAIPGSTITDPKVAFNIVPFSGANGPDADLYIKPSVFHADFAADLSTADANVLASEQRPLAASALQEKSGPPAWKTIPSYAFIGMQDEVLPPAEQEFMAARAHATIVKHAGSHLALVSHPAAVADLIARAAAAHH